MQRASDGCVVLYRRSLLLLGKESAMILYLPVNPSHGLFLPTLSYVRMYICMWARLGCISCALSLCSLKRRMRLMHDLPMSSPDERCALCAISPILLWPLIAGCFVVCCNGPLARPARAHWSGRRRDQGLTQHAQCWVGLWSSPRPLSGCPTRW
jgi:hypothetical protein